ncbi:MAG: NUDIX domain-containing protein, partial [Candidatus Saccharimonadales bacterium]
GISYMHPIKKEILRSLILNPQLRFARLKPDDIESNHFIYYLKQLIDEGLVKKSGSYYSLSPSGKQHAERISLKDLTVRLQPKIVTAPVVFDGDEVLLYRWAREPGYGQFSLVHGKLHFGEGILAAANRELKEKTNLEATLEHVGSVYIREFDGEDCAKHLFSHVFKGSGAVGDMKPTKVGEPVWVKRSEVESLDTLPGTKEILDLIDREEFFFEELDFKN